MKTAITAAIAALAISAIGITFAARDGSGTYTLPAGNPVSTGTTISSTWANNTLTDIATALTNSIAKDGQTVATANLPMGGFKHTNVADATSRNQYATAGQSQDWDMQTLSSVSGTDTIVGSLTPSITGYQTGMPISFIPASTNTGATTLSINGLSARGIVKWDGDALAAGDLVADVPAFVVTSATQFVLLNPQSGNLSNGVAVSDLARLSQANTFTAQSQGASTTSGGVLWVEDSDAGVNGKAWGIWANGGAPQFFLWNDAHNATTPFISVARSGTTVDSLTLQGTSINLQGTTVLANGTAVSVSGHTHATTDITSGTLAIARGGTGTTDGTARNITGKAGTTKTLLPNASCPPASGGVDGQIWYCY